MLHYSKIFSLALLVSIPSIAMELELGDIVPTEQNQEQAANANASTNELTQTIFVGREYVNSLAHLLEVEREKQELKQKEQELDQKEVAARESRNTALQNFLAKKTAREQSREGSQALVDNLTSRLLALEQKRAEVLAAEKKGEVTALEEQMSDLIQQKERALRDISKDEVTLRNIGELIEKTGQKPDTLAASAQVNETKETTVKEDPKPATPAQKNRRWYFLYLF